MKGSEKRDAFFEQSTSVLQDRFSPEFLEV